MRIINRALLVGILSGLIALPLWATHRDVTLLVSPHVLLLKSKGPPRITIHANVPYSAVIPSSVYLQITAEDGSTTVLQADEQDLFADNCGGLVAKFDADQVKAAVQPPHAIFLLKMDTIDGGGFSSAVEMSVR